MLSIYTHKLQRIGIHNIVVKNWCARSWYHSLRQKQLHFALKEHCNYIGDFSLVPQLSTLFYPATGVAAVVIHSSNGHRCTRSAFPRDQKFRSRGGTRAEKQGKSIRNDRSNFQAAFPTRIETNVRSRRGKRSRWRGPVLLRELGAKHCPHARVNTCGYMWHDACSMHPPRD